MLLLIIASIVPSVVLTGFHLNFNCKKIFVL